MATKSLELIMVSSNTTKPKSVPKDRAQAFRRYFVIKNKLQPNSYLRQDCYTAMKDHEKWGPIELAERFLADHNAVRFAERMVKENFVVLEAELPTTQDPGAFCRLTPK